MIIQFARFDFQKNIYFWLANSRVTSKLLYAPLISVFFILLLFLNLFFFCIFLYVLNGKNR